MPEGNLLLAAAPGADWPATFACFLTREPAEDLLDRSRQGTLPPTLWLGYASPIDSLSRQLLRVPNLDPIDFLDEWQRTAGMFLQLRRSSPDSCRLVNLMRLTPANINHLSVEAGIAPNSLISSFPEEVSWRDPCPMLDPRLVAVIDQRRVDADLFADIEACADLFGREPIFSLQIPPLRSPEFIEQCLESWKADRKDRDRWRQKELALEDRINVMLEHCSNAEQQRDSIRTEFDLSKHHLLSTREHLDSCLVEQSALNDKLSSLQEDYGRLSQEYASLSHEYSSLQELRTSLESQLTYVTEQLTCTEEQRANLVQQNIVTQQQQTHLEEQLALTHHQRDEAQQQRYHSEQQLIELQRSAEGTRRQLIECQDQLERHVDQLRQANEKAYQLELEHPKLFKRFEAAASEAELTGQLLLQTQEELEHYFLECLTGKLHAENAERLVEAQHVELRRSIEILQLLASLKGISEDTPTVSIQMMAILEGYRHSLKRAERLLASN